MRKNDYPKGESNGQRKATKEAIVKAIEHRTSRTIPTLKPVLLFLKDTGMRIGDARAMYAKEIYDQIQSNPKVISINIRTEKQHITQQTFIGEEAIQALKEYFELRQKGSQKVKPETITEKSPLFRTWRSRQIKRISRSGLSGLIYNAFRRINEAKMSAHSLRKYTQTTLEEANVNANWIDLIIGHVLPNSRGAYSLPDNEKLKEAYVKAYPFLRVYPDPTPKQTTSEPEPETLSATQPIDLITQLIQRGFEVTMNPNGTITFKTPNTQ
jgi:integrase